VDVSNLKISPLLLPHIVQSVRIGAVSANFIQDRRDDPTDAHKGMYNTLELSYASHIFGSQSDFVRVLARNATYHPITKKIVLARETSFGVQPAFKVAPNTDPSDPIPLPERFYGGGGNSLRAFPENQAGPRDPATGFPLGGSALFFNSTELRFPLFGDTITGVLFHDMGNVFDKLSDMSLRFHQTSVTDFNYTVHAVGTGVRYRTPIGPLRLDLAYSVNPPKFNGFGGTYEQLVQCSVNNTCGTPTLQHVSHFQFFFSIGQAF
jgi:outer membrane protein assembly factor BamA